MFISTCFVQSEDMQKKLFCAEDTDVQDASCSSCLQVALTKENVKNWKSFHHRQPSPNFTKNFDFSGQISKKFRFLGDFTENFDLPSKNWLFTAKLFYFSSKVTTFEDTPCRPT